VEPDPLAEIGRAYRAAGRQDEDAGRIIERGKAKRAAARAEQAKLRPQLHDEIVKAGFARRRPKEIADLTGYTPERIRQILRAAGVEPFERES
jgi:hypothetical protein